MIYGPDGKPIEEPSTTSPAAAVDQAAPEHPRHRFGEFVIPADARVHFGVNASDAYPWRGTHGIGNADHARTRMGAKRP